MKTHPRPRRATARAAALLLAAALPLVAAAAPPAVAQTTSAALTSALESSMTRPLTPPEAWGATAAARSHLAEVRGAREALAAALADVTGLPPEAAASLLPPLGRGPQSALPEDLDVRAAAQRGRTLTTAELRRLSAAREAYDERLAPHRRTLAETLSTLTDLPVDGILVILPRVGL